MGFYERQVVPRIVNAVLRGPEIDEIRRRTASGLQGEVLEIGFGSGLNVPHYPAEVRRVVAVDPASVGRKMASKRLAASPVPVEFVDLAGDRLPLDGESFDHVLITWTMCTIPAVQTALSEMRRVLRADGRLHFAEHGMSPDREVAKWQDRMTPLQKRIAGGCHLNRPINALLDDAGFAAELKNFYLKGPKTFGYMYEGVARKA